MLKHPCARSSGKVDGPTQTLGSFGGGDCPTYLNLHQRALYTVIYRPILLCTFKKHAFPLSCRGIFLKVALTVGVYI